MLTSKSSIAHAVWLTTLLFLIPADQAILAQPADAEAKGGSANASERESKADRRGIFETWWQRKDIQEDVGLTESQIDQLDALAASTREAIAQSRDDRNESFRRFSEALMSGDREAQAEYKERMATGVKAQAIVRADQMQKGLDLLTKEQRDKLTSDYPFVYKQSWLASSGLTRHGDGSALRVRRTGARRDG